MKLEAPFFARSLNISFRASVSTVGGSSPLPGVSGISHEGVVLMFSPNCDRTASYPVGHKHSQASAVKHTSFGSLNYHVHQSFGISDILVGTQKAELLDGVCPRTPSVRE